MSNRTAERSDLINIRIKPADRALIGQAAAAHARSIAARG